VFAALTVLQLAVNRFAALAKVYEVFTKSCGRLHSGRLHPCQSIIFETSVLGDRLEATSVCICTFSSHICRGIENASFRCENLYSIPRAQNYEHEHGPYGRGINYFLEAKRKRRPPMDIQQRHSHPLFTQLRCLPNFQEILFVQQIIFPYG
jgi:hypothetical protein